MTGQLPRTLLLLSLLFCLTSQLSGQQTEDPFGEKPINKQAVGESKENPFSEQTKEKEEKNANPFAETNNKEKKNTPIPKKEGSKKESEKSVPEKSEFDSSNLEAKTTNSDSTPFQIVESDSKKTEPKTSDGESPFKKQEPVKEATEKTPSIKPVDDANKIQEGKSNVNKSPFAEQKSEPKSETKPEGKSPGENSSTASPFAESKSDQTKTVSPFSESNPATNPIADSKALSENKVTNDVANVEPEMKEPKSGLKGQGESTSKNSMTTEEVEEGEVDANKSKVNPEETSKTEQTNNSSGEGRPFEELFWEYLQSNAYKNWAPAPGTTGDFAVGKNPHGAFVKMYLNRTASGNPDALPYGSIIVAENYSVDRKTMEAITVMYRSKDFDEKSNDWYWVQYNSDGSVTSTPPEKGGVKMMGKVNNCIRCHATAAGNDFTFFNDK